MKEELRKVWAAAVQELSFDCFLPIVESDRFFFDDLRIWRIFFCRSQNSMDFLPISETDGFFADLGIRRIFCQSRNLMDFFADLRIRRIFLLILESDGSFLPILESDRIFFADLRIRRIYLPISESNGFFCRPWIRWIFCRPWNSMISFASLRIRWIFIQFPANCQLDQRKRLNSNLGLKCIESLEYWNIKTMEYWILGILKQWNIKSLEYWNINKMKYWILGILEY